MIMYSMVLNFNNNELIFHINVLKKKISLINDIWQLCNRLLAGYILIPIWKEFNNKILIRAVIFLHPIDKGSNFLQLTDETPK